MIHNPNSSEFYNALVNNQIGTFGPIELSCEPNDTMKKLLMERGVIYTIVNPNVVMQNLQNGYTPNIIYTNPQQTYYNPYYSNPNAIYMGNVYGYYNNPQKNNGERRHTIDNVLSMRARFIGSTYPEVGKRLEKSIQEGRKQNQPHIPTKEEIEKAKDEQAWRRTIQALTILNNPDKFPPHYLTLQARAIFNQLQEAQDEVLENMKPVNDLDTLIRATPNILEQYYIKRVAKSNHNLSGSYDNNAYRNALLNLHKNISTNSASGNMANSLADALNPVNLALQPNREAFANLLAGIDQAQAINEKARAKAMQALNTMPDSLIEKFGDRRDSFMNSVHNKASGGDE